MKNKLLRLAAFLCALVMALSPAAASAAATLWGDADGNGVIAARDLLLLRSYMAQYDFEIGLSPVQVERGGDCDGSGEINAKDLMLLRRYLSSFNYATGEADVVLGPGIPKHPDPLPDGTLIYRENFEGYKTSSTTVLSDLGWYADTISQGAYKNNTTKYYFRDYGGSRQLLLDNNRTDCTDSYAVVLTAAQMGVLHEQNYTYQYDLTYLDAADAKRYVVLCSEYDGKVYNSFHLRGAGYANNQVHLNDTWYTYDVSGDYYASYTNSSSILTKLLGKTYNADTLALKNISLSIRYAVDWENGNTVSIRINTPGYPGSGKWTVVSKMSPSSAGARYFDRDTLGAAIALKTGGKQNAYVDNILIWTGTGDQPADLSSPVLDAHNDVCTGHVFTGSGKDCSDPVECTYCGYVLPDYAGHKFVEFEDVNDRRCTLCGAIESNLDSDWLLPTVPAFIGGKYSTATYLCGQGMNDSTVPREKESEMMLVSGVSYGQFSGYMFRLSNYGYEQYYAYSADGNNYAGYRSETNSVYTYYTASSNEVRVILDRNSELTPEEFSYTYDKSAGQTTVVYQYGLPMNEFAYGYSNVLNTDKKIDCGMMYLIKLADNSIVIIDGGGYQQFDDAQCDGLMAFLREVTGIRTGKITVRGWFFSHCHSDHLSGMALFIKKYGQNLSVERIFNNFPSVYSPDTTLSGHKGTLTKLVKYFDQYLNPNIPFIKLHTGEVVQLGEVKFTTIYTHEDIVRASDATTQIANDFNNSTTVLKIEFDGVSLMLLGDMNKPAQTVILANNSDATLKADIVQMAHHVFNDVSLLYNKIQAPVVFVPQAKGGEISGRHNKNAMTAVKKYLKNNMIYYADQGTYGLAVVNGKVQLVFEKVGVDGGSHTGWSW